MIQLIERASDKLPGKTSIFITSMYNQSVVDIIKCCAERNWNKNNLEWEVPIYELASLINRLILIDNIELTTLKEKQKLAISIPKDYKFKLPLYDYQLEGIKHGLEEDSWILGDEQGLGKTSQMIHLAGILKQYYGLKHCLVICGRSSLKNNWVLDIKKHSDLDAYILGTRIGKKSNKVSIGSVQDRLDDLKKPIKEFFIITNIETLRNDNIAKALLKNKQNIDMVVLDEAHVCKNPSSQQAKNLLKLTKYKRRIALTGTIICSSPLDTYIPMKWTGNESATFTYFKNRYCIFDYFRKGQINGYKNLDLLQKQLDTCMLRRTKKDKLNLPSKIYTEDYVDLTDKQAILYENLKDSIRDEIDKVQISSKINAMALSIRLRQCTAWSGIISSTIQESAKINRIDERLEGIIAQGDKAIIFSVFKETVLEMQKRYSKYGAVSITGDTLSDTDVFDSVNRFQTDPTCKVLIGTWQKIGTGLNLTAANYVLFVDTPWNDSDLQQCVDRAYRIGTTKTVIVIVFITKDTFDERVKEIVEGKADMSNYLVSHNNNMKEATKAFLGI